MSSSTWGTLSGSSFGITVAPTTAETRPKSPSGLIVTQAVQTKDGWLGQVIVDTEIVWESDLDEDSEAAVQIANGRVVEAFQQLFRSVDGQA